MTGAELLAFTRQLIQEASASFWTDAKVLINLNVALDKYAAKVNNSNNYYYLSSASITLLADTQSIAVPSGFSGTTYHIETPNSSSSVSKLLKPIPFNEVNPSKSGDPTGVCVTANTFHFDSVPSADVTYTCKYMAIPTAIADSSSIVNFPILHHALLGYEAAMLCRVRGKEDFSDLKLLRDEALSSLTDDLENNYEGVAMDTRDSYPVSSNSY